ncbi:MAG TPA: hypothetical protein VES42_19905 [Pilimelia sp.]|nr:hypothetical protein [Pilimelia sp.]
MAAVTAGGVVVRRVLTTRRRGHWPTDKQVGAVGAAAKDEPPRWYVVTVNMQLDEVMPAGQLPEPLAELGDAIEVQVRPAPGDKGTELAARLTDGEPSGVGGAVARLTGADPRQDVRSALRKAKQLLETGEVLSAHSPPTAKSTLLNKPLELAIDRSAGEGRL